MGNLPHRDDEEHLPGDPITGPFARRRGDATDADRKAEEDREPEQKLNCGAVIFAYAHDKNYVHLKEIIGDARVKLLRAFYRKQPLVHPNGVALVAVADYYRRPYRKSTVLTWDDVAWETCGLRVTSDAWEP